MRDDRLADLLGDVMVRSASLPPWSMGVSVALSRSRTFRFALSASALVLSRHTELGGCHGSAVKWNRRHQRAERERQR